MRVNLGDVTNPETGKMEEIIAKSKVFASKKSIIIGAGLVLLGIGSGLYTIARSAYKNGALDAINAETLALDSAGLINWGDGTKTV